MGKIISIVNQKGGVGKTTTAINLAASLAVSERKTLLIDLDPQGNATSGVGVERGNLQAHVYHALIEQTPMENAILPTEIESLDILPSDVSLSGAEIEFVNEIAREKKLKNALEQVDGKYHYIIIDCPPSLGILTLNSLAASKSVLIPIQCEYYALEGVSQLLNTIRLVQKNLNPFLSIEGILLTMYDRRLNLSMQVAKEARRFFGDKVYNTIIPRNVKLSEAPSFGKPIILYDIQSVGARSYLNLAMEMIRNE